MNRIFSYTINKGLKIKYDKFLLGVKNPYQCQESILKNLISKASHTQFGMEHGFSSLRNDQDFRTEVPINDYNSLKPYIEKMMAGDKNILWPGKTKWFAKSSGTTSDRSKFIPVSADALENCHYKAGKELISIVYHLKPETEIHYGSGLVLGGSHQINNMNNHSRVGDLSSILLQNLPLWAKFWQEPSYKSIFYEDWEKKIEIIAERVLTRRITHITGVPTWTLVLFNKLLEISGKKNISEIWPSLELYAHGGVSFTPYLPVFKEMIPNEKMTYLETYNASEGFFGVQDQIECNDLLLLTDHGIFYEFLPFEDLHNEQVKTLTLEEVETGKNYALIISTNAGLWRYLIGDTIRFTSTMPYRFRLTGRTKHFINAFGEEVIIENAEKALAEACHQTNATINDFTAAPVYFEGRKKGAHEWIIEFAHPPLDMDVFTTLLDKRLKSLNSDYETKRYNDLALTKPIIHSVSPNTFYQWMKYKNKLGGQNKVPRLSNDRTYVDDILNYINSKAD